MLHDQCSYHGDNGTPISPLHALIRQTGSSVSLITFSGGVQCAGSDDSITMKAEDTGDVVSFMFEAPQQERFADFELKLMDIDAEQLGIPDTDYAAKYDVPKSSC